MQIEAQPLQREPKFMLICKRSEVVTYGSVPFYISLIWNKKMRFPLWGSFFPKSFLKWLWNIAKGEKKKERVPLPFFVTKNSPVHNGKSSPMQCLCW